MKHNTPKKPRPWIKLWREERGEFALLPFVTRGFAGELLKLVDENGELKIGGSETWASAIGRLLHGHPNERRAIPKMLEQLASVEYLKIDGSSLSILNWVKWQGTAPNGSPACAQDVPDACPTVVPRVPDEYPKQAKSPESLVSPSTEKRREEKRREENIYTSASPPDLAPEKVVEWLDAWRRTFKVNHGVTYTKARVSCVKAAFKRHGHQKCFDALRGYASAEWYHGELGRHDVSVILGPGGNKGDKVIHGLEKLALASPSEASKLPEPTTDAEAAEALLKWASGTELQSPEKFVYENGWTIGGDFHLLATSFFNPWVMASDADRPKVIEGLRAIAVEKLRPLQEASA